MAERMCLSPSTMRDGAHERLCSTPANRITRLTLNDRDPILERGGRRKQVHLLEGTEHCCFFGDFPSFETFRVTTDFFFLTDFIVLEQRLETFPAAGSRPGPGRRGCKWP